MSNQHPRANEHACFDAVVVGAGPAGSMSARLLAQRAASVLLVDRKAFPRPKVCGACVNERALSCLKQVGLGSLAHDLGAVAIRRFHLWHRHRSAQLPLPGGVAVSREAFDAALVHEAVASGAIFRSGVTATLEQDAASDAPDFRTVRLDSAHHDDGASTRVRARVVLIADGLAHRSLAECGEFHTKASPSARVGLGGRLDSSSGSFEPGTITMAVGREGYVGIVRVEDASLNIAAAIAPNAIRGYSPAAAIGVVLRDSGLPRIAHLDSTDWRGTIPLTRRLTRPVGRRVFVLGDAAGYVEPFTGEGIAWALAAGIAVAPLADRARAGWTAEFERQWLGEYRRIVRKRQRSCRVVASLLRQPWLCGALVRALALWPAAGAPVIRALNRPVPSLGPAS